MYGGVLVHRKHASYSSPANDVEVTTSPPGGACRRPARTAPSSARQPAGHPEAERHRPADRPRSTPPTCGGWGCRAPTGSPRRAVDARWTSREGLRLPSALRVAGTAVSRDSVRVSSCQGQPRPQHLAVAAVGASSIGLSRGGAAEQPVALRHGDDLSNGGRAVRRADHAGSRAVRDTRLRLRPGPLSRTFARVEPRACVRAREGGGRVSDARRAVSSDARSNDPGLRRCGESLRAALCVVAHARDGPLRANRSRMP